MGIGRQERGSDLGSMEAVVRILPFVLREKGSVRMVLSRGEGW